MSTQPNNYTLNQIIPSMMSSNSIAAYMARNLGTPWVPVWGCDPVYAKYNSVVRRGSYLNYVKAGTKNVPYVPSIHNDIPTNYSVTYQRYDHALLQCGGIFLRPSYSGTGINCPDVNLPRDAACAVNPGLVYSNLILDQRVRNTTLAKVNGKIMDKKAVTTDWATFIGESRDTRKMMANTLYKVATVASLLKKGRYTKAHHALFGTDRSRDKERKYLRNLRRSRQQAANLWLEWTYGWSPLLGTVYDAAQDLRTAKHKPLRFIVRSGTESQNSFEITQSASFPILTTQSKSLTWKATRTDYVKHNISLCYEVKDTIISDLTGAGIMNPALVAWELVPYSFVIDWFVNVGDWLQSQTIGNGLRFIYGSETTVRRVTVKANKARVKIVENVQDTWKLNGDGNVSYSFERHDVSRGKLTSHPPITLGFQLNPLSVRRAISAAALLTNSLSGIFKPTRR